MMNRLKRSAPDHMTEALRTNMAGGKTVDQLLGEAAGKVPFMSLAELRTRLLERANDLIVLDVRERASYAAAHIPGPQHLPRCQLELRVNPDLPPPPLRTITVCDRKRVV